MNNRLSQIIQKGGLILLLAGAAAAGLWASHELYAASGAAASAGGNPPAPPALATPTPSLPVIATTLPAIASPTPGLSTLTPAATSPANPAATALAASPTASPSATTTATLSPQDWQQLPIVPQVSQSILAIYQKGLALGNHPDVFSKVGDCNSLNPYYLSYLDKGPSAYNLGDYTSLQGVIDYFHGSFQRDSLAVGNGFNTSALLSSFRADPNQCTPDETPLTCEYRHQKPIIAIIAIGTDDYIGQARFEANLRSIVETTIQDGIIPILVTQMEDVNQMHDNVEIARVAQAYHIPVANLWRALQPLPRHGLGDNTHPSGAVNAFQFSPFNLGYYGWPVRNLTVLQALDAVWKVINPS